MAVKAITEVWDTLRGEITWAAGLAGTDTFAAHEVANGVSEVLFGVESDGTTDALELHASVDGTNFYQVNDPEGTAIAHSLELSRPADRGTPRSC